MPEGSEAEQAAESVSVDLGLGGGSDSGEAADGVSDGVTGDVGGAGSESLDASDDSSMSILDRLMNTEPSTDLGAIDSPWQPADNGGIPRIYRGIQKIGDVEGLPAIADIIIGILEVLVESGGGLPSPSSDSDEDGEGPEYDVEQGGAVVA